MSIFEQIPSGKKVDGLRYAISPAELKALIENVSKLDSKRVADTLKDKYKDTIPGTDPTKNTFEMMALYQHGMNLLGNKGLEVDGKFGRLTHGALQSIQENLLGFQGKDDVDGLPGPKTTAALINALQTTPAAPVSTAPAIKPDFSDVTVGFNSTYSAPAKTTPAVAAAPAQNIDTAPYSNAILQAVQKIPGLEKTTSLSSLGFRFNQAGKIIKPEGIERLNTSSNNDWSVLQLAGGYQVIDGKIVRKTAQPAQVRAATPQVQPKPTPIVAPAPKGGVTGND